MRAQECFKLSDAAAASDQVEWTLQGGVYVAVSSATFGGGSITLETLAGDGSTWITAATAVTAAGVSGPLYLPPGKYRVTIATATAVYYTLSRVPFD
jgi:hypothetical protein